MFQHLIIDIIKNLSGQYKVIFTGVGNDCLNYAEQLQNAGCDFINLVNKTSVNELALVLKRCEALISVDTGTMHLGYALDIPTLAVFYEPNTSKCWAPDENLYNVKIIKDNQTSQNITDRLAALIKEKTRSEVINV